MEKEFIPYEQALSLKELGFDEPCFGYYQQEWHDDGMTELEPSLQMIISKQHQHAYQLYTAPLYQQAFRWFRKKHGLFIRPDFDVNYIDELDEFETTYFFSILEMEESLVGFKPLGRLSSEKTYEEAELACINKLIEIVKNK